MMATLHAFVGPLLSLLLFLAGSLLHPVAYMLAFVPLLEVILGEKKDFYALKDTLQSLFSAFFVLLFVALWLFFHFSLPVISALAFAAGAWLVIWLTSLAWRLGKATSGYFGFLFFWLGFEYALLTYMPHYAPPSLGALMAQGGLDTGWYADTGVLGGTLWVLLVNVLLFTSLRRNGQWSFSAPRFFYMVLALLLTILPIILAKNSYADLSILPLSQSPWIEIPGNNEPDASANVERGEYIGLIGFWMGIFLAVSVFVKQKTRLKFRGRT